MRDAGQHTYIHTCAHTHARAHTHAYSGVASLCDGSWSTWKCPGGSQAQGEPSSCGTAFLGGTGNVQKRHPILLCPWRAALPTLLQDVTQRKNKAGKMPRRNQKKT